MGLKPRARSTALQYLRHGAIVRCVLQEHFQQDSYHFKSFARDRTGFGQVFLQPKLAPLRGNVRYAPRAQAALTPMFFQIVRLEAKAIGDRISAIARVLTSLAIAIFAFFIENAAGAAGKLAILSRPATSVSSDLRH